MAPEWTNLIAGLKVLYPCPLSQPFSHHPVGAIYEVNCGASGASGVSTCGLGGTILGGVLGLTVTLTVGGVKLGRVSPAGPATFILPIFIETFGSFTVTVATVGAVIVAGAVTVGAVTVGAVTVIAPICTLIFLGVAMFNSFWAAGGVNDTTGADGVFTTGAFTTGNINNFASTS